MIHLAQNFSFFPIPTDLLTFVFYYSVYSVANKMFIANVLPACCMKGGFQTKEGLVGLQLTAVDSYDVSLPLIGFDILPSCCVQKPDGSICVSAVDFAGVLVSVSVKVKKGKEAYSC